MGSLSAPGLGGSCRPAPRSLRAAADLALPTAPGGHRAGRVGGTAQRRRGGPVTPAPRSRPASGATLQAPSWARLLTCSPNPAPPRPTGHVNPDLVFYVQLHFGAQVGILKAKNVTHSKAEGTPEMQHPDSLAAAGIAGTWAGCGTAPLRVPWVAPHDSHLLCGPGCRLNQGKASDTKSSGPGSRGRKWGAARAVAFPEA